MKKAQGSNNQYVQAKSEKAQNDTFQTATLLSREHGVSPATIKRDGQFATAVESLKSIEPEIESKIISKQAPPKKDIIQAALAQTSMSKGLKMIPLQKPPFVEDRQTITRALVCFKYRLGRG